MRHARGLIRDAARPRARLVRRPSSGVATPHSVLDKHRPARRYASVDAHGQPSPAAPLTVGFGHEAVLGAAGTVLAGIEAGAISRFFLIGGCDGDAEARNYYTELAESVPESSVILTLGLPLRPCQRVQRESGLTPPGRLARQDAASSASRMRRGPASGTSATRGSRACSTSGSATTRSPPSRSPQGWRTRSSVRSAPPPPAEHSSFGVEGYGRGTRMGNGREGGERGGGSTNCRHKVEQEPCACARRTCGGP